MIVKKISFGKPDLLTSLLSHAQDTQTLTPADKIKYSCSEKGLSLIIAWLLPQQLYYQE